MNLVVGHNCPGCGLDTPEVACEACGAGVVWNRRDGSHCGACGASASTIVCVECGLRAELDRRHDEPAPQSVARPAPLAIPNDDDEEEEDRHRRLPAWASMRSMSPALRPFVAALSLGVPALLVVLLAVGRDEPGPAGGSFGVAARASRDVTIVGGTGLLPVPLQPPPPRPFELGPPPRPFEPLPAPTTVTQATPDDGRVHVTRSARPARREGWLQRVLKSGRISGPVERINGG